MAKAVYVIQYPNSNTNHSDSYQVVDADAWTAFINGAAKSYPIAFRTKDYDEAVTKRNELNAL